MANPLNDKLFLRALDQQTERIIYARIVALNWDEEPVAEISAMVTGGSISIDGSSAVRRTCNLAMVTSDVDVNRIDWSIRTKFRLFIGLENKIDSKYEDIIWFPQGIFVTSSYSATYNSQGYNINLQGKDKMSLLNGDMGGNLFAKHDFGVTWIFNNDGSYSKKHIPIKEIVREAVHQYAQEKYENIYINDLDTCGVELVDYRGDGICWTYNIYDRTDGVPTANILIPGTNNQLEAEFASQFESNGGAVPIRYRPSGATWDYEITKRVKYGDTIGYRATDLTYAGELIEEANGTITSMLDKIVQQLGEFEYFYDTQGHFVFQRKRIYFNSSWSSVVMDDNQTYYESKAMSSQFSYEFTSNFLIESFANKPKLNAIKNDYAIWGQKTAADGTTSPIHLRYAIDRKPTDYYSLSRKRSFTTEGANGYDWRWLVYLMSEDYMAANYRIAALQRGLDRQTVREGQIVDAPLWEVDYNLVTEDDYDHLYYYDELSAKFIPMAWNSSEKTMDAELGKRRIQTHVLQNLPLFTEDIEESLYAIRNLSAVEQQLISSNGGVAARYIANNIQNIALRPDDDERVQDYRANNGQRRASELLIYYYYPAVLEYIRDNFGYQNIEQMNEELFHQVVNLNNSWLYGFCNQIDATASYYNDLTDDEEWNTFRTWIIDSMLPDINGMYHEELYNALSNYIVTELAADSYQTDKARRATQEWVAKWEEALSNPYSVYSADMLAFLPSLYKIEREIKWDFNDDGTIKRDEAGVPLELYTYKMERQENGSWQETKRTVMTQEEWEKWRDNNYWNPDIFHWNVTTQTLTIVNPESLFFWIDFIDYQTDLWQYGPELIGRRSKVEKDDKVKAIYFKDTPDLLFVENYSSSPVVEYSDTLAYTHINVSPTLSTYLYMSSQGKSAKEELDNLIYNSTYYQDTITLSTVPIYYLEPNTRIFVQDKKSGISGEYIIKSMTIPLAHDGMMSLNANRASERII